MTADGTPFFRCAVPPMRGMKHFDLAVTPKSLQPSQYHADGSCRREDQTQHHGWGMDMTCRRRRVGQDAEGGPEGGGRLMSSRVTARIGSETEKRRTLRIPSSTVVLLVQPRTLRDEPTKFAKKFFKVYYYVTMDFCQTGRRPREA